MDCDIPAFKDLVVDNLYTFEPSPLPGRLVKVPYPVWDDGEPVTPHNLEKHASTNYFDLPKCYHSFESVLDVHGRGDNKVVALTCGIRDKCDFRLCVTDIIQNPTLLCRMYRERGTGSSDEDDNGSSSEAEFVSSDSALDGESEDYEPNSSQDSQQSSPEATGSAQLDQGTSSLPGRKRYRDESGLYTPPPSEKENPYYTRAGIKRRRLHPQASPLSDLRRAE